jgi:1,2-phenylacetyl-CoA epoxidase catalytic subunit
MGNQKDYLKQYYAEHKEKMITASVEWRKQHRDHYNKKQKIHCKKYNEWNKIVRIFRNILIDGY